MASTKHPEARNRALICIACITLLVGTAVALTFLLTELHTLLAVAHPGWSGIDTEASLASMTP